MIWGSVWRDKFEFVRSRISEVFYTFELTPPSGPPFWPRSNNYRILINLRSSNTYMDDLHTRLHKVVEEFAESKGIKKWSLSIRIPLRGSSKPRVLAVPRELIATPNECRELIERLGGNQVTVSNCTYDMFQYLMYFRPKDPADEVRERVKSAIDRGKYREFLPNNVGLYVKPFNPNNPYSWIFDWSFYTKEGVKSSKPKVMFIKDGSLFINYASLMPVWLPTVNLISLILKN